MNQNEYAHAAGVRKQERRFSATSAGCRFAWVRFVNVRRRGGCVWDSAGTIMRVVGGRCSFECVDAKDTVVYVSVLKP